MRSASSFMRTLLLVALTFAASCKCKAPSVTNAPKQPLVAPASSFVAPQAPPDVFGVSQWSLVFALLTQHELAITVPACADSDAGCGGLPNRLLYEQGFVPRRLVAVDEPQAFLSGDISFLAEPERLAKLERAIDAAMTVDASHVPIAAVLFQNDVFERVDAIRHARRRDRTIDWAPLTKLERRLLALADHLALPEAVVRTLPSNEARVEAQFPELLTGFASRRGWHEVLSHSTESLEQEWRHTSRHSQMHDHRLVFRVFVRADEAVARGLVATVPVDAPEGTRFVLAAWPVARTKEGTWAVAPFVTLIETREGTVFRDDAGVADLPNDVLEGSRLGMVHDGGLERLSRTALIPSGATCMPDTSIRVPVASACLGCHGPVGRRLSGPRAHGDNRLELTSDENAAARFVLDARREWFERSATD